MLSLANTGRYVMGCAMLLVPHNLTVCSQPGCGVLRLHWSPPAAHGKCVTAIAADRAGARLLTGGEDYQLQMFDFGGMKRDMRSFRKLEPMEGYPINALSFSPSGACAGQVVCIDVGQVFVQGTCPG